MIKVTDNIFIEESEIEEKFVLSSGPGGQNINKVATAVQLRFDVANSPSLPDAVRKRLYDLAGTRMTDDGTLIIEAKRYRTQQKNRQDAVNRLIELIGKAARRPKTRRKTRPTLASKRRRLDAKRLRAKTKRMRQRPSPSHNE